MSQTSTKLLICLPALLDRKMAVVHKREEEEEDIQGEFISFSTSQFEDVGMILQDV